MARESTGCHGPQLPQVANPLDLAVAADADPRAVFHHPLHELGVLGEHLILVDGGDRQGVLDAGIPVNHVGEIELEVQSASVVGISSSVLAAWMIHCSC